MPLVVKTFFSIGFRPFFLSAAFFAGLGILSWVGLYSGWVAWDGALDPLSWHAHEMIFGYLGAVLAGFTLTAVANWTGRPPISGVWLAVLFVLWLAGRVSMALSLVGDFPVSIAALIDVSFIPAFISLFAREVIAGGNKRNLVVVAAVSVFGSANVLFCLDVLGVYENELWLHLALGTIALLLALIGGRIIPTFTGNWLKATGRDVSIPTMGLIDKAGILLTALSALGWTFLPEQGLTATLLVVAGCALLLRLSRWQGLKTVREPLIACLHIAYAFLGLSLIVIGLGILVPEDVPAGGGLHLLTAGTIGLMTVVVMCRALLGHTGRALKSTPLLTGVLGMVIAGGLMRFLAPWWPESYSTFITVSGFVWGGGFLVFAFYIGPILVSGRKG